MHILMCAGKSANRVTFPPWKSDVPPNPVLMVRNGVSSKKEVQHFPHCYNISFY